MLDTLRALLHGSLDLGGFALMLGIILALWVLAGIDTLYERWYR